MATRYYNEGEAAPVTITVAADTNPADKWQGWEFVAYAVYTSRLQQPQVVRLGSIAGLEAGGTGELLMDFWQLKPGQKYKLEVTAEKEGQRSRPIWPPASARDEESVFIASFVSIKDNPNAAGA